MSQVISQNCSPGLPYYAEKCKVIVMNEHGKVQNCRQFSIGPSVVSEADSYCHLGVICERFLY